MQVFNSLTIQQEDPAYQASSFIYIAHFIRVQPNVLHRIKKTLKIRIKKIEKNNQLKFKITVRRYKHWIQNTWIYQKQ